MNKLSFSPYEDGIALSFSIRTVFEKEERIGSVTDGIVINNFHSVGGARNSILSIFSMVIKVIVL